MSLPAARKILVTEVAGLGDNVHLLPALWLVRRTYPDADLHVLGAANSCGIFRLTPWVDRVWGYPWNPRPPLLEHVRWGLRLRREQFDLTINFSGSDRTTTLMALAGAPERWGRRPHDGGMRGFALFHSRVLEHPFYEEPMYVQKWALLRGLGFGGSERPEYHVTIRGEWLAEAGMAPGDAGHYLHVSPYASAARKELAEPQMADLLDALHREHPHLRLVLSCGPTGRERDALERLLGRLATPPWRVFAGTLDIPQLAAVIQGAALHLSPDTGSFHLAQLAGTPYVVWYRKHGGEREWVEPTQRNRVLYSDQGDERAMSGVDNASVLGAVRQLLAADATA
jgi:ADP-heptose:LPS heptosyltransferase